MSTSDDRQLPAQHSGVDTLISELKDKGVKQGQEQAKKIVSEAEERAHFLVSQAELEAERIKEQAQSQAAQFQHSAQEALNTAARDLILELKDTLQHRLAQDLRQLVQKQFRQDDFLARFLTAIAGQARDQLKLDQVEDLTIQMPNPIQQDEPARVAEKFAQDELGKWITNLTGDMLRQGVQFTTHDGSGIRVTWNNDEMELDLTTEALTELLLDHIQPRFRALLDAIWK